MPELIEQIAINEKYINYCKKISKNSSIWQELHQEFLVRVIEKIKEIKEADNLDVYLYVLIYKMWNDPKEGRFKTKTHRVGTSPFYQMSDNEQDLKDYHNEISIHKLNQQEKDLRSQLKKELNGLINSDNERTREQGVFLMLYTEGMNRLQISKQLGVNYRLVHEGIEEAIRQIRAKITGNEYMTKTTIQMTLRNEGCKLSYSGKAKTFYVDKMPVTFIVNEIKQAGFNVCKK